MKSEKGAGNPLLIAIVTIVIAVLLFGGYKLMTNKNTSSTTNATPTPTASTTPSVSPSPSDAMEEDTTKGETKTFIITGAAFSFTPNAIKVKKGDTVEITFVNAAGTHDLIVDGYGVGTKILATGQSEKISFVANKAGTFEFYCGVANHRAMGMKGTLTVE